ncbi:MAG: flotillin domain-containing protein, partial [Gemmobacter sp.]
DQALAVIARARAEADAVKIAAEAERAKGEAEAATIRARVEAENALSPEVMAFKLRLAKIEALPAIIREMVEPARHIQSFRINQITGMGGAAAGGGTDRGSDGIVDQVMSGMQRNAVALPILTALGREIGIDFTKGMEGIAGAVDEVAGATPSGPNGPV